jgi:hypothetical protein
MKRLFTDKQKLEIKKSYEDGASSPRLGKTYRCSAATICNVIREAGGVVRTNSEAGTLYFRNPLRERRLVVHYGLKAKDVDFIHRLQKGLCLWCLALLPSDPLQCYVDHIGGTKMTGKSITARRKSVRGLCCPHNICNMLAGRVEKDGKNNRVSGLLTAAVKNIKRVLKTNHGNIQFPSWDK